MIYEDVEPHAGNHLSCVETLPCVGLLSHTGVFLLCEAVLRNHYLTVMFGPSGHVEACQLLYLSA